MNYKNNIDIGSLAGDGNIVANQVTIKLCAAPKSLSDSEIINNALNDTDGWKYLECSNELCFYNENFLDIRIVGETSKMEEYNDFWARGFPAKSWRADFHLTSKGQKVGGSFIVIFVNNDGRSVVVQPERWDLKREKIVSLSEEKFILSYYFTKGSRKYLLDQIIQKTYCSYRDDRLLFPVFESKEAAYNFFKKDITNNKRESIYYSVESGSWKPIFPWMTI